MINYDIMVIIIMQEAVDTFGLSALDRLFCFMIVRELQNYIKYLQRSMMRTPNYQKTLKEFTSAVGNSQRLIRKPLSSPL